MCFFKIRNNSLLLGMNIDGECSSTSPTAVSLAWGAGRPARRQNTDSLPQSTRKQFTSSIDQRFLAHNNGAFSKSIPSLPSPFPRLDAPIEQLLTCVPHHLGPFTLVRFHRYRRHVAWGLGVGLGPLADHCKCDASLVCSPSRFYGRNKRP